MNRDKLASPAQISDEPKKVFIAAYIAAFLGAYSAKHYDDNCMKGWPTSSMSQPVEDAEELAEEAWRQI